MIRKIDIDDNSTNKVVCENQGVIVGSARFRIFDEKRLCIILNIDTKDIFDEQTKAELMDYIKREALQNNCTDIELDVSYDDCDAVDFSSLQGFEPLMYKMNLKINLMEE